MPPQFSIRPAEADDAPGLAAVLQAVGWFAPLNPMAPAAASDRARRYLAQCAADDSHAVWVAAQEGGPVLGYVTVHWLPYLFLPGPEGFVSELFVRPDAAGQGIGGELLAAVIAEARRRGCSRLSLLNRRDRESYLRGFYVKHGWQERTAAANMIYDLSQT